MRSDRDATSQISVWRDQNFLLIWFAMLCSTAATFLFLLAVSVSVLASTGSNFAAAAVFACQWVLPVVARRLIGHVLSERPIRIVLIWSEASGLLVALLVGAVFDAGLWIVLGILTLRGLTDALTKSGRTVAIKLYMPPYGLGRAAALFNTSQFAGSALGAIFGAALIETLSLRVICFIAAVAYFVALLCYAKLPNAVRATASIAGGPLSVRAALKRQPALCRAFHYLILTIAVFQGYHTVARSALPTSYLGLPPDQVVYVSLLSSVAVLVGVLFVGSFWSASVRGISLALGLVIATDIWMLLPLAAQNPSSAFAAYFVFMFVFELSFAKFQKTVVVLSPVSTIGHISASGSALGTVGMAAVVVVAGCAADRVSLLLTAVVVAVLGLAWALAIAILVPDNVNAEDLASENTIG